MSARSTKKTPSSYCSSTSAASSSARRVLPVPPGPVRVSSRARVEQFSRFSQLAFPADQGAHLNRQVRRSCVERPERREVARQAFAQELVEPLRARQVLEPVLAEIAQQRRVDQKLRRRRRDQHLPPVRDRRDARRAVDVGADVALVGDVRRSGVDAHADADGRCGQTPLGGLGGCQRSSRRREGNEERVPLCIHLHPTLARKCRAHDPAVILQRVGIALGAELGQEPRRALDVGEEKRDGSGRKLPAHPLFHQ